MKKKKRNYIGASECSIWMRNTYVGKDVSELNRNDLEASDADIGRRFSLNRRTVASIRRRMGIGPSPERICLLASRRSLEGVEVVPEQKPKKPASPSWINVGEWVIGREGAFGIGFDTIARISSIDEKRGMFWVDWNGRESERDEFTFDVGEEVFFPIRFRSYSFDEAKGLLGKVMEWEAATIYSKVHHARIIDLVSRNANNGNVLICGDYFAEWKERGATIDGVPIGIPEIVYEACHVKTPEK